jgi:hypothetical protein
LVLFQLDQLLYENKYLKSYFADNADIENYYEISNNENATPILNILGQKIYAIERKQDIPKQVTIGQQ